MNDQTNATEQKRRTVTIACAIPQGIKMTVNDPHEPGMVILKHGTNPNIDKEFADRWREANANLTVMPYLTFTDDPDPERAESAEENDDGSGRSAQAHDGIQDHEAAASEDAGVRRGDHDVGDDAEHAGADDRTDDDGQRHE